MLRKTKIIGTIGPSEEPAGIIEQLLVQGMDIARFKIAPGGHAEAGCRMDKVRCAARRTGRVTAFMLDIDSPQVAEHLEDICFGVHQDMDFVAVSFVQSARDVLGIRRLIEAQQGHMEIIAKIEDLTGVQHIDEILYEADGIMIARGKLGGLVPVEDVPMIQKLIIGKCNAAGKPVIVATQLLESMKNNPRPTRAETSDVANAILDGADAIMLSGETAEGSYPVESVSVMDRIARRIESSLEYRRHSAQHQAVGQPAHGAMAMAHAAVQLSYELTAAAIVTPTVSGYTAAAVSAYRPRAVILAVTSEAATARHISLRWGVKPFVAPAVGSEQELLEWLKADEAGKVLLHSDDEVIVTSFSDAYAEQANTIQVCLA